MSYLQLIETCGEMPSEPVEGWVNSPEEAAERLEFTRCACEEWINGSWHDGPASNEAGFDPIPHQNGWCCEGTYAMEDDAPNPPGMGGMDPTRELYFRMVLGAMWYDGGENCNIVKSLETEIEHPSAKWKKKHNKKIEARKKTVGRWEQKEKNKANKRKKRSARPTPTSKWKARHKTRIDAQTAKINFYYPLNTDGSEMK